MAEDDYWDSDWCESDDVPTVKEAKAKKAAGKHLARGDSSSVAQCMKERRAQASSATSGGVATIVNLDENDEYPQVDAAATVEEEHLEVEEPAPQHVGTEPGVRSESKEGGSEQALGTTRKSGAPLLGLNLKKPQFR